MPMATALSMVVMMKLGVTRIIIWSWSRGSASRRRLRKSRQERREGLIQRVLANQRSRPACAARRPRANFLDRNVDSSTKRQLTVHL